MRPTRASQVGIPPTARRFPGQGIDMKLLDRFFDGSEYVIRGQNVRTGGCEDILVSEYGAALAGCSLEAAIEQAACIWGGRYVPCVRHDGVLHFRPEDGVMTCCEFETMDDDLEMATARAVAPEGCTDEQIHVVLDQPMSCSQRQTALQELAS